MEPQRRELEYRSTQVREDGTPGPARTSPRLRELTRADITTAVLGALAILFCASSLYFGPPREAGGAAFVWTAPLVAAIFFVAMMAMFANAVRHGIARALFSGGAIVLAVAGVVFLGEQPASRVIVSYWVPAILAIGAALRETRGHHAARGVTVEVRRPSRRAPRA